MNSKEKNIDRLYKARAAHTQWVNSIKLLISGLTDQNSAPSLIIQESSFGHWYYNEALHFAKFNCAQVLMEIEELIGALYDDYTKIYMIYFGKKQGMLQNIFGVKNSVDRHENELATVYYENLLDHSDKLKKKFATLERQYSALSLEQHDSVHVFGNSEQKLVTEVLESNTERSYSYGPRSH